MLDEANVIGQRDPSGALKVAEAQWRQVEFDAKIWNGENDGREIANIVVVGMGGSALAPLLIKVWLSDLKIPFEVVRSYELPGYVGHSTLVIASSYSGNTEETLACLEAAEKKGAQLAIVASGGKLIDEAASMQIAHVQMPTGVQPRIALFYNLRGLVNLLAHFNIVDTEKFTAIADLGDWLHHESQKWAPDILTDANYAKQLALATVGKTPIFYGGELTAPLAYYWKISCNETAKNVSFWNQYSEFNHNEFIGWTSHPIEKPFAVFDLISDLENPQILKRFEISDRLLSGMRPKAHTIQLAGKTLLAQLLWGSILADFVSIYLAILNNVDPVPVALIEKLKTEL